MRLCRFVDCHCVVSVLLHRAHFLVDRKVHLVHFALSLNFHTGNTVSRDGAVGVG